VRNDEPQTPRRLEGVEGHETLYFFVIIAAAVCVVVKAA